MKRIYMLLIASCGWSCDSFLDVNPKAEVIDEDMFSTASGVEDTSIVYSALSNSYLYSNYMSVYYRNCSHRISWMTVSRERRSGN
ncbi:MAG: hypothetical protein ACLUDU_06555 [Butyricimonas faecihominis]